MKTSSSRSPREQLEIDYYRTAEHESPESNSLPNVLNKMRECGVLMELLPQFDPLFRAATDVLEVGGGQGWASCALKRQYPSLRVTLSDISPYATQSAWKWEKIFGVRLDDTFDCPANEIPLPDASLDMVFCYSSAHHFARPAETFVEIFRVLRPGGVCLFLHEPVTSRWLHGLALRRVNRKRPEVPEYLIVPSDFLAAAEGAGFESEIRYSPLTLNRGPVEGVYFMLLRALPFLQKWLPCSANFVMRKAV